MKKILLVIRSLRGGGMEAMTVNLANALSRQGHDVSLLVYKKQFHLQPDEDVKIHQVDFEKIFRFSIIGIPYELMVRIVSHYLRGAKPVFISVYFSLLFKIWLYFNKKKSGRAFDLIIARGYGSFDGLGFISDSRLVRVIVNSIMFKKSLVMKKLFFRLSFNGNHVVSNSYAVMREFEGLCHTLSVKPRSRHVIGNPTDFEKIRSNSKSENISNKPYILNVGRLEDSKNQSLLIEAYSLIANQITHNLVIVGDGTKRQQLQKKTEALGIADRVSFVGWQSNSYPWMSHADLFVLSSKHEGLPNVVIEALACNTPVVAVKGDGGNTELMRDELSGFIAEPTPESLSNKMLAALESPPRIPADLLTEFDMYNVANTYLKLYT